MSELKNKMVKGAFWAFLERFGLQIVGFVVTLFLSRLLTPDNYGTVALLTIFTSITGCLVDAGFGEALIQKKDATELDFNTVFYFSIAASSFGYLVLFCIAPWVADFYKVPELTAILRVTAVTLILNCVNSVQHVTLKRNLQFDLSFKISLSAALISGVVGITMAFKCYGAWALVWSTVSNSVTNVVVSWWLIGWRPKLMFSFKAMRELFGFGWKLSASFLFDKFYQNLYGLLIGKFYTKADLAFVNKGRSLPGTVMQAVIGSVENVAYPVLAQTQDDKPRFVFLMRKMLRTSAFLVLPMMTGVAVCTPSFVVLAYGSQWLPAVIYMQLICFQLMMRPFDSVNLRAILAMGKSDIFLKLEILKKILGFISLAASIPFGVLPFMLVATFVYEPLTIVINAWPNKKLFGYTIVDQVKDVMPSVLVSMGMAAVIVPIHWLPLHPAIILPLQIVLGAFAYIVISMIFRLGSFVDVVNIMAPKIGKRIPLVLVLQRHLKQKGNAK